MIYIRQLQPLPTVQPLLFSIYYIQKKPTNTLPITLRTLPWAPRRRGRRPCLTRLWTTWGRTCSRCPSAGWCGSAWCWGNAGGTCMRIETIYCYARLWYTVVLYKKNFIRRVAKKKKIFDFSDWLGSSTFLKVFYGKPAYTVHMYSSETS